MTKIETHCEHSEFGARARVTDNREYSLAQANVWVCVRPCCVHAAFHTVHDATGRDPMVVPLPPV